MGSKMDIAWHPSEVQKTKAEPLVSNQSTYLFFVVIDKFVFVVIGHGDDLLS